ncbi:MAG: hypothetical protein GY706_08040 [Bacteroides sp.]|nr:hypothetical protein [Bacteroides sp.]
MNKLIKNKLILVFCVSVFATLFSLSNIYALTYCNSSSNNSSYEWVDSISIGTVLHTSGGQGQTYQDFTAVIIDLQDGYNAITLTPGYSGYNYNEYWRVWIDYNEDGVFDEPGEKVFEGVGNNAVIGSFAVSLAPQEYQTGMRVTMKYGAYPSPCETGFSYGQVVDYMVKVPGTPAIPCVDDLECDDGLFCNGTEFCGADQTCQSGTNPCPGQGCEEDTDSCVATECLDDVDCDDNNSCTVDICADYACINEYPSLVSSYPYVEGFESGLGDWENVTGDDMNWTRRSGTTPSYSTGPSGAHGGLFYAYTEASSPNYPGKTAILEGPTFDLSTANQAELTFWYHMYGAAMGTLYVEVSDNCQDWTSLWSLSGDQGNLWHEAIVDLNPYIGQTITIRFRGVTGSSYTSDIAVDDITVSAGQDTTPPTVISTTPVDGAVDVPTANTISVEFSEPMDTATITTGTFLVNNGNVTGSVTYDSVTQTATFDPDLDLTPETIYTVMLTKDLINDIEITDAAGNVLDGNGPDGFSWSFESAIPPSVNSISPSEGAVDVSITTNITVTFSEPMDGSTITTGTFLVNNGNVLGTVTYNSGAAIFDPDPDLSYGTTYTITLTEGITDATGNILVGGFTASFTCEADTVPPTVISETPIDAAQDVPITCDITATFSEPMDETTITTDTFLVNDGAVSGTVIYDSGTITATFDPDSGLLNETIYNVTLTDSITDASQNILVGGAAWSFTTASELPLHVPTEYPSIQAAVDASVGGETIIVADGTYTENVTVDKSVIIKSEKGSHMTTVTAENELDHVFEVVAENVTIEGFTICGAYNSYIQQSPYSGIYVTSTASSVSIINNHLGSSSCRNNSGITIYASNCTIAGNFCEWNSWVGIRMYGQNSLISSNECSHNRDGILLSQASGNTLTGNITNSNGYKGIFVLSSSNNNVFENNNCLDGIRLQQSSNNSLNGNSGSGTNANIFLDSNSNNNIISGNVLTASTGTITIQNSYDNTVSGNSLASTYLSSIDLRNGAANNTITNNTCAGGHYSINITGSSNDNTIYLNSFLINDTMSVQSFDSSNQWHSPDVLNYTYDGSSWSGYLGNYYYDHTAKTDSNGDGITDAARGLPNLEPNDDYPLAASHGNFTLE